MVILTVLLLIILVAIFISGMYANISNPSRISIRHLGKKIEVENVSVKFGKYKGELVNLIKDESGKVVACFYRSKYKLNEMRNQLHGNESPFLKEGQCLSLDDVSVLKKRLHLEIIGGWQELYAGNEIYNLNESGGQEWILIAPKGFVNLSI
jgi:hypothetical protein